MTPAEFKRKWSRYRGKETSAYQEHFNDLCRLLGHPTPAEADPSGSDFFCFQKYVTKDAEFFQLSEIGEEETPEERGFADVWKKGCFGWEYKGKRKNLDEAYRQLLRYREALENPPLLVVCDFDRFVVRTNFNGTIQETYEFTNEHIDRPEFWRVLRSLFENPDFLKPQRTTAQVTEALAESIAEVAKSLQKREAVELADATTRAEMNFAQRKNLRIARFLNRIVFCFFAEDTGLLPQGLFSDVLKSGIDDPGHLARTLETLFAAMAKGGVFGKDKIRHFNGHLFEESTVFELTDEELRELAEAGEADWQFIQPSIMGTLFERAMEPGQRSQLGAHYTSEADIVTLVEPVLMAPLRREWDVLKGELAAACAKGKGTPSHRDKLAAFQRRLAAVIVLDPACGSGNFLYVSLRLLLGLEKEVITCATQLGFKLAPQASVQQLRAIEINPYAFELAQVAVQIGYLQWRRDNGFDNDRSPVLQDLNAFQNEDALLVPHFRSKAKTLKAAQAGEHAGDDALKFYTEREWPACDVIVGNPPFLGGKLLRRELGDSYVEALFDTYSGRVRPEADLCCYWFEKARSLIEARRCMRAGMLATQGIRGGANRRTLGRIKETGDIFFALSDHEWILAGATVHVSMIGFDDGTQTERRLDGKRVGQIEPQLLSAQGIHRARPLRANAGASFMGITPAGPFDLSFEAIGGWFHAPNPNGRPNSDVLRPYLNGQDINQRTSGRWTVDFGVDVSKSTASQYELPFRFLELTVRPIRETNRRESYARNWWLYAEARPAMREAFEGKHRFLSTCMVAKHRLFAWLDGACLPANVVIVFARDDDLCFGILSSRFHLTWAGVHGTQLREKESGSRYTPTTCFETFPFPFADDLDEQPTNVESELDAAKHYAHIVLREELRSQTPADHRAAIAAAAAELNELRERWLHPLEWTETRLLEFAGTVGGPWDQYIDRSTVRDCGGFQVGTVRYPRLEPRNAECAAKLKRRTLTNLYNERPAWLDLAHKKLDAAVARAYGWDDFAQIVEGTGIGTVYDFKTGGFEILETTPEGLEAATMEFRRKFDERILERLLALNLKRAAEEEKAAKAKKPKGSRGKHDDEML